MDKKNKESLAIVRQMVADGQVSQEVAEKYFPELAESDDEKIRKKLINIVTLLKNYRELTSVGNEEEYNEILAWLEKQGEQKPIEDNPCKDCINRKGCINCENGELRETERKRVEWSEEDELFLIVCKNALSKYQVSDKWDAAIISRWLENKIKFARPQKRWKPDTLQIQCLEDAIERYNKEGYTAPVLVELLENLKAL